MRVREKRSHHCGQTRTPILALQLKPAAFCKLLNHTEVEGVRFFNASTVFTKTEFGKSLIM